MTEFDSLVFFHEEFIGMFLYSVFYFSPSFYDDYHKVILTKLVAAMERSLKVQVELYDEQVSSGYK